MEWDHWPNEGYPCRECGRRGTCTPECTVRENDPTPRVFCPECKCELPGHRAMPPCSQLKRPACLDCGLPYAAFPLDVVLPRAQWLAIHPDDDGVLCAACIVKRVKARVPGATVVHAVVEVSPVYTLD